MVRVQTVARGKSGYNMLLQSRNKISQLRLDGTSEPILAQISHRTPRVNSGREGLATQQKLA